MTDSIGGILKGRIQLTHKSIISITEDLTDAQFAQQPSPTAPPIGWHLFHMARWADRLQASTPVTSDGQSRQVDPRSQIWTVAGLATKWGLRPDRLGSLEAGTGMDIDSAVEVALLGGETLERMPVKRLLWLSKPSVSQQKHSLNSRASRSCPTFIAHRPDILILKATEMLRFSRTWSTTFRMRVVIWV